jgi:hypothetical protein
MMLLCCCRLHAFSPAMLEPPPWHARLVCQRGMSGWYASVACQAGMPQRWRRQLTIPHCVAGALLPAYHRFYWMGLRAKTWPSFRCASGCAPWCAPWCASWCASRCAPWCAQIRIRHHWQAPLAGRQHTAEQPPQHHPHAMGLVCTARPDLNIWNVPTLPLAPSTAPPHIAASSRSQTTQHTTQQHHTTTPNHTNTTHNTTNPSCPPQVAGRLPRPQRDGRLPALGLLHAPEHHRAQQLLWSGAVRRRQRHGGARGPLRLVGRGLRPCVQLHVQEDT